MATATSTTKDDSVVEYVGTADVRKISASDWKSAGVEDQKQVVWDGSNGHKVKASELSKAALDVLTRDPGFKLPEA